MAAAEDSQRLEDPGSAGGALRIQANRRRGGERCAEAAEDRHMIAQPANATPAAEAVQSERIDEPRQEAQVAADVRAHPDRQREAGLLAEQGERFVPIAIREASIDVEARERQRAQKPE